MAESTIDGNEAAQAAALQDAARALDRARMKQIGGYHFAMVMGALTMWGAAETWARVSGWSLAAFASIGTALVAGSIIPSVLHEWGHFAGARLSGAKSPVLEKPRNHFFMFDFPIAENDLRQFTWMSWGGILVPWAIVLLTLLLVPLESLGAIVLLATFVSKAVAVTVFEGPVTQRAGSTGDPAGALGKAVGAGALDQGRNAGILAGVAVAAIFWLVA